MSIDHDDYSSNVRVRPLSMADFDRLVEMQLACFPGMKPWRIEQVESQLAVFPEGQLGVEVDGTLMASSASLIVMSSEYTDWHDWLSLADSGFIRNHDPHGDTLYGIEIMVHPDARGLRLARRLYDARKEICRKFNLVRMMAGGRIPGFSAHKGKMSAEDYVAKVVHKELYDPVLTAQIANGFQLKRLIPDYLPSDEDSSGYATHIEWANSDHVASEGRRQRRAYDPVRVSLVQYPMRPINSWDEFERQCTFFVDVAADHHADFVLFPELFTLQLLGLVKGARPGTAARALAGFTPQYLELFQSLAVRYNTNIIGGSQFIIEDDRLLNMSYLFRRDGSLARQAKIHVTPNERRWWGIQGGDTYDTIETDRGTIAIAVCYDIEFPELSRIAAEKGAYMVFCPFNTNDRYGYLRVRSCAQARAIENQCYVMVAGCVGALPQVENADLHYAQSAVLTPSDIAFARDGVAAEASANLETVVIHEIDIEAVKRARRSGTVRNWDDRRTDLYRVHAKVGGDDQII